MRILFIIIFFSLSQSILAQNKIMSSIDEWSMKAEGMDRWIPVEVPGSVQWNLIEQGLIPDPTLGTNEDSIQWIEDKDWIFKADFETIVPKFDRDLHLVF